MLTARNSDGQILLAEYCNEKINYYCPECGYDVILKYSDEKTHHFAHKVIGDCDMRIESEKQSQIKIEYKIGNQRADVFAKLPKGNVVIEIQCSPISIEEARNRNDGWKNKECAKCKRIIKQII